MSTIQHENFSSQQSQSAGLTPVLLVDEEVRWIRRPRDLAGGLLALATIALITLVAIYGNSTSLALTYDVRSATEKIIGNVLLVPMNVVEGLISFFLPLVIILDLLWHRRWRTLLTSIASAFTAAALAYGIVYLAELYFPVSPLTQQLSISVHEQSVFNLYPSVAVISGLLTVASSRGVWRITGFGWPLLTIGLAFGVVEGRQTLAGALITVFLGVMCGKLGRFTVGDTPERTTGLALIRQIRRAGIAPVRVIRIDDLSQDSRLCSWNAYTNAPLGYSEQYTSEYLKNVASTALGESVEREFMELAQRDPVPQAAYARSEHMPPINPEAARNYIIEAQNSKLYHALLVDTDRAIVGLLQSLWNRLMLTTSARRADRTVSETANRIMLNELAVTNARMCPDRQLHYSFFGPSALIAFECEDLTPISSLSVQAALRGESADEPSFFSPHHADELWETLLRAHRAGFSHGNICAQTVCMRSGHVALVHWSKGSVGASEVARRIDIVQCVAFLATLIGTHAAVESARRALSLEQLQSVAPMLQGVVVPNQTMAYFTSKKDFQALREEFLALVPHREELAPARIQRFSLKTILTVTVGMVAIYLLLASINLNDLRQIAAHARPGWIVAAVIASLACYVGAALPLVAYTTEKIPFMRSVYVQLAGSVINLVAPAGIGHAALNLRFLQKHGVRTAVGVATVSLVQVAQFVTTVALLLLLGLVHGDVGSFETPSTGVLIIVGIVALGVAIVLLVPKVRTWVIGKIRPTIEQIWPRLVWLGTHPKNIFLGLAGATLQTVAYVAAFGFSLAAFGYDLPIVTLAITYLVSNSVGAVVPSPGGIGPVEAALTVGLTAAGVPYSIAFSATLLFRLVTFWLPIPLGWFAFRHCQKANIV